MALSAREAVAGWIGKLDGPRMGTAKKGSVRLSGEMARESGHKAGKAHTILIKDAHTGCDPPVASCLL